MTDAQLRPFLWMAWLGVITTALNTGIQLFPPVDGIADWRDKVLLIHAPATFFPIVALVLVTWRQSPFAASTAVGCTFLEKAIEFTGQSLILFPPQDIARVAGPDAVGAVWNQMYFTLWWCNTAGATAAGLLMKRLIGGRTGWLAAGTAWGAGIMTLMLLLADYGGFEVPFPPGWLFALIFTGYRLSIVRSLAHTGPKTSVLI